MSTSPFANHLRIATPKILKAMHKTMNQKNTHQIHKQWNLRREGGDGTKEVTKGTSILPVIPHF